MEKTSTSRMTPQDFFLNLGALIMLYITVPTLLALLFSIIDVAFPPVQDYYYSPSISFPVATLIVVFPLYLLLIWMLGKSYILDPQKRNLGIKKWLTYITLFITGLIITADLVTLLYHFLDGQLITSGFVLKVLSVFIVAAAVFVYHITDLRNKLSVSLNKIYGISAAIIILLVIILGFSIIGSPRTQRLIRYDQIKINDLQAIQSSVSSYYQQTGGLPANLGQMNDPLTTFNYNVPKDSQTNQEYEYRSTSSRGFELCATFNKSSLNKRSGYQPQINDNWQHAAGHVCFSRTIDLNLDPVRKSIQ